MTSSLFFNTPSHLRTLRTPTYNFFFDSCLPNLLESNFVVSELRVVSSLMGVGGNKMVKGKK